MGRTFTITESTPSGTIVDVDVFVVVFVASVIVIQIALVVSVVVAVVLFELDVVAVVIVVTSSSASSIVRHRRAVFWSSSSPFLVDIVVVVLVVVQARSLAKLCDARAAACTKASSCSAAKPRASRRVTRGRGGRPARRPASEDHDSGGLLQEARQTSKTETRNADVQSLFDQAWPGRVFGMDPLTATTRF